MPTNRNSSPAALAIFGMRQGPIFLQTEMMLPQSPTLWPPALGGAFAQASETRQPRDLSSYSRCKRNLVAAGQRYTHM